jgi:hypothetical protein
MHAREVDELERLLFEISEEGILPEGSNIAQLLRYTVAAIELYLDEIKLGSLKTRHDEMDALRKAAQSQRKERYQRIGDLLDGLSEYGRQQIERRGKQRSITIPTRADLQDQSVETRNGFVGKRERRDWACEDIGTLVQMGGHVEEGRKRPSGRRSQIWVPLLLAPASPKNQPKREWERVLIERLQVGWRAATGKALPKTVSVHNPHPFVKFASRCLEIKCLNKTTARHSSIVDLFNEISKIDKNRRANRPVSHQL